LQEKILFRAYKSLSETAFRAAVSFDAAEGDLKQSQKSTAGEQMSMSECTKSEDYFWRLWWWLAVDFAAEKW